MAKIDIDGDGKPDFTINISQIIAIGTIFVSMIGSYYTLKNKIEQLEVKVKKAESLPQQEVNAKDIDALKVEYDLKIEKVAVQAAENMDEIKAFEKEVRNNYKRSR